MNTVQRKAKDQAGADSKNQSQKIIDHLDEFMVSNLCDYQSHLRRFYKRFLDPIQDLE